GIALFRLDYAAQGIASGLVMRVGDGRDVAFGPYGRGESIVSSGDQGEPIAAAGSKRLTLSGDADAGRGLPAEQQDEWGGEGRPEKAQPVVEIGQPRQCRERNDEGGGREDGARI